MASEEKNNKEFRENLLRQAKAYRRLAEERARKFAKGAEPTPDGLPIKPTDR